MEYKIKYPEGKRTPTENLVDTLHHYVNLALGFNEYGLPHDSAEIYEELIKPIHKALNYRGRTDFKPSDELKKDIEMLEKLAGEYQ